MNLETSKHHYGTTGKVYLVGAGPGDPRLLTIRGLQCLRKADCVLFDGLVNPALLDLAPRSIKTCVGKHGKTPIWAQSAINEEMIRLAKQGLTVVRLKGGDPAVFGRTAEELEALAEQHIPFEVVPGITAALAVAGYSGIPLTHRDHASAVALVTGQQQEDCPTDIDWEALARFPGTLSIYMGVTNSRVWSAELIAAGKPPETPAAIVRRCSWSDQQVILCRLAEVAEHLSPSTKMRPPVLVVVGPVAHLGQHWNWFAHQPLFDRTVWVPRAAHQATELVESLMELGANVIAEPVLRIDVPSDTSDLHRAVELLKNRELQGITFSSSNGVDGLLNFVFDQGYDARLMAGVRLAAVGPATAQQLRQFGLNVDVVPQSDYSAEGLLAILGRTVGGQNWLVTTTNRSRPALAEGLRDKGASVTSCLSYQTVPVTAPGALLSEALKAGRVNIALITSSAIGQYAHELLGDNSHQVQPFAVSQAVANTLSELGWPAVGVAESNTTVSLLETVIKGGRGP